MLTYFSWHGCLFGINVRKLKLGNMKLLALLMVGGLLTSFANRPTEDEIDGVWMGYYRSQIVREKLIIKFNTATKMEFYTGGVDDRTRTEGSYHIKGDSVSISYRSPNGEEMTLVGHFNYRKNFVDGTWKGREHGSGSFYLEKQQLQEFFAEP
jgi:hypothetical protein